MRYRANRDGSTKVIRRRRWERHDRESRLEVMLLTAQTPGISAIYMSSVRTPMSAGLLALVADRYRLSLTAIAIAYHKYR